MILVFQCKKQSATIYTQCLGLPKPGVFVVYIFSYFLLLWEIIALLNHIRPLFPVGRCTMFIVLSLLLLFTDAYFSGILIINFYKTWHISSLYVHSLLSVIWKCIFISWDN